MNAWFLRVRSLDRCGDCGGEGARGNPSRGPASQTAPAGRGCCDRDWKRRPVAAILVRMSSLTSMSPTGSNGLARQRSMFRSPSLSQTGIGFRSRLERRLLAIHVLRHATDFARSVLKMLAGRGTLSPWATPFAEQFVARSALERLRSSQSAPLASAACAAIPSSAKSRFSSKKQLRRPELQAARGRRPPSSPRGRGTSDAAPSRALASPSKHRRPGGRPPPGA